jgi:hypothetical protein
MIEPRNVREITASEITIGELLQSVGYATAHFGKWHINGGGPASHGYDEGDGNIGNEYAHEFSDPNPADIFGMAKRAVAFMERNKRANKPFFVQISWHALHAPQNAMKDQPRAQSPRPALPPLRGAKITGFENSKAGSYVIRYDVLGDKRSIEYTVAENGSARFIFVSGQSTASKTYMPQDNGAGGGGGRRNAAPPPGKNRSRRGEPTGGPRGPQPVDAA